MKVLYQLKNLDTGEDIAVTLNSATVGRDESSDIVIEDEQLSRRHVRLDFHGGELTAEDLQSTNGTYHNEQVIAGVARLEAGDTLRVGDQTLLVVIDNRGASRTVIGDRVARVASYVLEKHSSEDTAIRQGFTTPTSWSAADRAGMEWLQDAESEQLLTEQLQSPRIDTSRAAAALLVAIGDDRKLFLVPRGATGAKWVLGRGSSCDITLEDLTVSTRHATLLHSDDGWKITDNDSRNGIKVNGVRHQESSLAGGDKLQLGRAEILFRPL